MSNPIDREVAVFSAVRRLPAQERAAYLDEACAGDGELRQRVEDFEITLSGNAEGHIDAMGAQRGDDELAAAEKIRRHRPTSSLVSKSPFETMRCPDGRGCFAVGRHIIDSFYRHRGIAMKPVARDGQAKNC